MAVGSSFASAPHAKRFDEEFRGCLCIFDTQGDLPWFAITEQTFQRHSATLTERQNLAAKIQSLPIWL